MAVKELATRAVERRRAAGGDHDGGDGGGGKRGGGAAAKCGWWEAWAWLQWWRWRWWRSKGRSRRYEGSPVVWLGAMLVTEGAARGGDVRRPRRR